MMNEITELSNSINIASNNYYRDLLTSLRESYSNAERPKASKNLDAYVSADSSEENMFIEINEELKHIKEMHDQLKDEIPNMADVPHVIADFRNEKNARNWVVERKKQIDGERKALNEKIFHMSKPDSFFYSYKWTPGPYPLIKLSHDSLLNELQIRTEAFEKGILKNKIQAIDINLNAIEKKDDTKVVKSFVWTTGGKPQPADITFKFPDFTIPTQPRVIKYNYSTDKVNAAFVNLRNKNVLITSGLFLLSIVAIFMVSRRFTHPIQSLKGSFENVVDGNLDVNIPSKSRDEIGDLTNSFNQMVFELQKNREREKILQQKERLASMGQLAAGVAHEIKNPLNAINLTIDHLRDKFSSSKEPQIQDYINTIQSEIRRLDKIVNNLLSFIRSENLQIVGTDVNGLIGNVIHLLKREIESQKIDLKLDLQKKFVHPLDGERFKTVIMNVILNALQAMPDGGKLAVSVNPDEKCIVVKDTGAGISAKDLEHIFDLFYTTKSSGTGLGLPTAYKIMKEHNGDIQIASEVGKGTEVRIQL